MNLIQEALRFKNMGYHETIFELHISLGAREGSRDPRSGMCGLTWDRFKDSFTKVDLYESKVRGGILWRDCPLNIFFSGLPQKLRNLWESRGKPIDEKLFLEGYKELLQIYQELREALTEVYQDNYSLILLHFRFCKNRSARA